MSLKDDLLAELDEQFAALQSSCRGLSQERMTQPWLGSWGVREILVHIGGWLREMTTAYERLASGEKAVPDEIDYSDQDEWNALFVEERKLAPVAEVLEELQAHYRHFRQAAAAVPQDRWGPDKTTTRLIHSSGIDHFRTHAEQIRQWRRQQNI